MPGIKSLSVLCQAERISSSSSTRAETDTTAGQFSEIIGGSCLEQGELWEQAGEQTVMGSINYVACPPVIWPGHCKPVETFVRHSLLPGLGGVFRCDIIEIQFLDSGYKTGFRRGAVRAGMPKLRRTD